IDAGMIDPRAIDDVAAHPGRVPVWRGQLIGKRIAAAIRPTERLTGDINASDRVPPVRAETRVTVMGSLECGNGRRHIAFAIAGIIRNLIGDADANLFTSV